MSGAPPQGFFLDGYKLKERRPWDISKPQPSIVDAYERGLFVGEVADLGCGLGDNAIFLASKGVKVTALDFSPEALEEAKKRLARAHSRAPDNLTFVQGSALELDKAFGERQFSTVLDSALLHCFSPALQKQYVDSLTPHVQPDGKLLLVTFSDENKDPWQGPARLSKEQIHDLLNRSSGWEIESIVSMEYSSNVHGQHNAPSGTGWAYFTIARKLDVSKSSL